MKDDKLTVENLNDEEATEEIKKLLDEDEGGKKPEKGNSALKEILSWVIPFAVAIAVVILLKQFVIINATVPTGSMENTIQVDDNLFGLRLAYNFSEPKRGDVVIFPAPDKDNEKYIKRIIGLPGETVTIKDGQVYIDGELLEEDYVKEDWSGWNEAYEDPSTVHTYVVPEGCYFLMGDNRNNSSDARFWRTTDESGQVTYQGEGEDTPNVHLGSDTDPMKFVKKEDIIGKAVLIYWPLSHFGGL